MDRKVKNLKQYILRNFLILNAVILGVITIIQVFSTKETIKAESEAIVTVNSVSGKQQLSFWLEKQDELIGYFNIKS